MSMRISNLSLWLIRSVIAIFLIVLSFHLLKFNYYVGNNVFSLIQMPTDIAITPGSFGLLNQFVFLLLFAEGYLGYKCYKIIKK